MTFLAELASSDIKLIVGIVFAAGVLVLLAYIFFKTPVLTDDQRKLLRFFCAFMAGCAGTFISGEALFKLNQESATNKMAVEGTAGFALFFAVWFTFEPLRRSSGGTGFAIRFVEEMSFARASEILGEIIKLAVNLDALTPAEKAAKMRGTQVQAKTPENVLAQLNEFVKPPDRVRAFDLKEDGVVLRLVPRT